MKSAYCIAVILCFTVLWLYEKKKENGFVVNPRFTAAAGYGITRLVLSVIAGGKAAGYIAVFVMDLVVIGLCFYLSEQDNGSKRAWESLVYYIWNPAAVMAVLSQIKRRMVLVWLTVMIFSLCSRRLIKMNAEKGENSLRIKKLRAVYILFTLGGAGWIWACDIAGEKISQCAAGDNVYPVLLILSAAVEAAAWMWLMVPSFSESCKNQREEGQKSEEKTEPQEAKTDTKGELCVNSHSWTGRDWCLLVGLTLLFGIMAFTNLGSTKVPQTAYRFEKDGQKGNEMVLRFDTSETIGKVKLYLGGKEKREFAFFVPNKEGDGWKSIMEPAEIKSVFCWNSVDINYRTYALAIVAQEDVAEVMEIVLLNQKGERILPNNTKRYETAFDEQEMYPEYTTYEYGTMFDEIYHARTAYEILHKLPAYEITHPPLGKALMSLGIAVFGMNPFGWRCVCALFGTLMVSLCYVFMRAVSKNTWISAFSAALMMFDFMHFTLSRIGTIDVIVAFFILLTFYLMYLVLERLKNGFHPKVFLLMLLNGCAAGAAMAVKWTGVYACAGIALLFFLFLFREYGTAKAGNRKNLSGTDTLEYLGILFGGCVLAYLLIPAGIYLLSYLSYSTESGKNLLQSMWDNQIYMLKYHENTVFEHPYSSQWYEWFWIKRPLLDSFTRLSGGKISVISTFGNPLIWWGGIPALFFNLYLWQIKRDERSGYLCISYFAMLVPWFFIHRTVFIYQYFACSTILVLMLGNSCRFIKQAKKIMVLYLLAVIAVFMLFYPVMSGYPVSRAFSAEWLEWLESWVLS